MNGTNVYTRQGFGKKLEMGSLPALVLVDFTVGFNDPELLGGGNIDAAVQASVGLLAEFRQRGLPVAHSRIVIDESGTNAGIFAQKVPILRTLTEHSPAGQTVPQLTPVAGELIIKKTEASAFFETGFVRWLIGQRIDSLVVAGCTTSGCVRATVVDAASWNFRPFVVSDCVGDRALAPHEANLFDMQQKYAEVLTKAELVALLPGGLHI